MTCSTNPTAGLSDTPATVTGTDLLTPPVTTVTVALPLPTARSRPAGVTVTTFASEEDHGGQNENEQGTQDRPDRGRAGIHPEQVPKVGFDEQSCLPFWALRARIV